MFFLRTSDPASMKIKETQLQVAPSQRSFIRLWFAPVDQPCQKELFIFVNDEEDQNEECLLVQARFVNRST